MASGYHLTATEHSETFDVFRLPIELRYKIWEVLLLYENIRANPEWSLSEDHSISRPHIPGFFRPWAVPCSWIYHTRTWTWGDYEIQQLVLFARTPPLFLVSKAVTAEARKLAYRNIVVEICGANKNYYLPLLSSVATSSDHPMLRSMRNLYICAKSRLWSGDEKPPSLRGNAKDLQELFNDDVVPLFKLKLNEDGTELGIHAQRQLNKQHMDILVKETRLWLDSQGCKYRFTSRDLWAITIVMQTLEAQRRVISWYVLPNEKDRLGRASDALAIKKAAKPIKMYLRDRLDLNSNFEAAILTLSAPCARNIKMDEDIAKADRQR